MGLPNLTRATIEGYVSQSARDIALDSISTRVSQELDNLKDKNRELYDYAMEIARELPKEKQGLYLAGFAQCFSLLNRQDDVDNLENRAKKP